ncbi:hypothetical protein [Bacillus cereus]|uniref:hypothetical protein n=1 Tax=Bacillus cereus TaxID=1396 RepID=UPI001F461789|nr:hypothetical protein [Bacillus cereus]BCC10505.1 hypothetical protein BCM0074_0888 [Bacillus cereus]BCC28110.1 hypothetical protein BCM0100_0836 [Bacillus cereus]
MKNKRIWLSLISLLLIGGGIWFYFSYHKKGEQVVNKPVFKEVKEFPFKPTEEKVNIQANLPSNHTFQFLIPEGISEEEIPTQLVKDENGNNVKTEINIQGQTLFVNAPDKGYKKGGFYEFRLPKTMIEGKELKEERFNFTIKRDNTSNIVETKNAVHIKRADVKKESTDEIQLQKNIGKKISKGHILFLAQNNKDELAYKVESVQEENDYVAAKVSKPKFDELFEILDVADEVKLNKEDFVPAEGVTLQEVTSSEPTASLLATKGEHKELEFKLNKTRVNFGDTEFTVDGSVFLKDPTVKADIGFISPVWNRYNMSFKSDVRTNLVGTVKGKKQIISDGKNLLSNLKGQKHTKVVPVTDAFSKVVNRLPVVVNVNLVFELNIFGELTVHVEYENKNSEAGVIAKGAYTYPYVSGYNPKLIEAYLTGSGGADGKAGIKIGIGIGFAGVTTLTYNWESGWKYEQSVSFSSKIGKSFCEKRNIGKFDERYIRFEFIDDELSADLMLGENEEPDENLSKNTCDKFEVLIPERIYVKPGETKKLGIQLQKTNRITGEVEKTAYNGEIQGGSMAPGDLFFDGNSVRARDNARTGEIRASITLPKEKLTKEIAIVINHQGGTSEGESSYTDARKLIAKFIGIDPPEAIHIQHYGKTKDGKDGYTARNRSEFTGNTGGSMLIGWFAIDPKTKEVTAIEPTDMKN